MSMRLLMKNLGLLSFVLLKTSAEGQVNPKHDEGGILTSFLPMYSTAHYYMKKTFDGTDSLDIRFYVSEEQHMKQIIVWEASVKTSNGGSAVIEGPDVETQSIIRQIVNTGPESESLVHISHIDYSKNEFAYFYDSTLPFKVTFKNPKEQTIEGFIRVNQFVNNGPVDAPEKLPFPGGIWVASPSPDQPGMLVVDDGYTPASIYAGLLYTSTSPTEDTPMCSTVSSSVELQGSTSTTDLPAFGPLPVQDTTPPMGRPGSFFKARKTSLGNKPSPTSKHTPIIKPTKATTHFKHCGTHAAPQADFDIVYDLPPHNLEAALQSERGMSPSNADAEEVTVRF